MFGNTSYNMIAGGTGSGDVNKAYTVSLVQGLTNAGFQVDSDVQNAYETYISDQNAKHPKKSFMQEFRNPTPPIPELLPVNKDMIGKKAEESDVAIITYRKKCR